MVYPYKPTRLCFIVAVFLALYLWAGRPKAVGQTPPGIDFFSGVNVGFKDMD